MLKAKWLKFERKRTGLLWHGYSYYWRVGGNNKGGTGKQGKIAVMRY